jgi:hypothetical protein
MAASGSVKQSNYQQNGVRVAFSSPPRFFVAARWAEEHAAALRRACSGAARRVSATQRAAARGVLLARNQVTQLGRALADDIRTHYRKSKLRIPQGSDIRSKSPRASLVILSAVLTVLLQ